MGTGEKLMEHCFSYMALLSIGTMSRILGEETSVVP